jgi:hypothetical protein
VAGIPKDYRHQADAKPDIGDGRIAHAQLHRPQREHEQRRGRVSNKD